MDSFTHRQAGLLHPLVGLNWFHWEWIGGSPPDAGGVVLVYMGGVFFFFFGSSLVGRLVLSSSHSLVHLFVSSEHTDDHTVWIYVFIVEFFNVLTCR